MNPVSSDETPAPHTDDDLGAEIVIKFKAIHLCSSDDFGKDQYFKSFEDLVKSLINDEGLLGIVEDDYEILSIRALPVSSSSSQPQVTREKEEAGGASTGSTDTRGSKEEESGWIQTALRPPTKEDGHNHSGEVFVKLSHDIYSVVHWRNARKRPKLYPLWMRIPPVPEE